MNIVHKCTSLILNILTIISVGLAIFSIILLIFDIKPFYVQSGSMAPEMKVGSLAFINSKETDFHVGDVVAFHPNGDESVTVTHRIHDVLENGVYQTKGDANSVEDVAKLNQNNIIGKYLFSVPNLGYVMANRKQWMPFLALVLISLIGLNYISANNTTDAEEVED